MSVSTTSLHSFFMRAWYHFPSCTTLNMGVRACVCVCPVISSEIQLSKGQVSSTAPLHCSLLQNANTRLPILANDKSSDLMTSLVTPLCTIPGQSPAMSRAGAEQSAVPGSSPQACKVRRLKRSQSANLCDYFKWTISDKHNHVEQPPSAGYYPQCLPHLLFLCLLNWLTVFGLVMGCLLACLVLPVGLSGQTRKYTGRARM